MTNSMNFSSNLRNACDANAARVSLCRRERFETEEKSERKLFKLFPTKRSSSFHISAEMRPESGRSVAFFSDREPQRNETKTRESIFSCMQSCTYEKVHKRTLALASSSFDSPRLTAPRAVEDATVAGWKNNRKQDVRRTSDGKLPSARAMISM